MVLFAAVGAGVWTFALMMDMVVLPLTVGAKASFSFRIGWGSQMKTICRFATVKVIGEWDDAEDGVDVQDGDAVLAVDHEANDFDGLHDAGEVIEPLLSISDL